MSTKKSKKSRQVGKWLCKSVKNIEITQGCIYQITVVQAKKQVLIIRADIGILLLGHFATLRHIKGIGKFGRRKENGRTSLLLNV